jgi:uncharacterized protein (TIGR00297 family)
MVLLFLCLSATLAVFFRKLTIAGGIAGVITGWLIYKGAGWNGLAMLAGFFISATVATSYKSKQKAFTDPHDGQQGARTAGQVLANGGMAGLIGGLTFFSYPDPIFPLLIAACLSSATADTLSSEFGTVFGKRFYNILTLKPDEKGLDGVISVEGTIAGLAGSMLIALIYAAFAGFNYYFIIIIIAGTAGNIFDSLLGALLERKGLIKNDMVNFLNTVAAAGIAWMAG